MGSTRRQITDEYRVEAVRLVTESGNSMASVAKNIGVNYETLRGWVKKAKKNANGQPATSEPALTNDERAELVRLRKENMRLEMELSFAKKVATWHAKNQP